LIEARILVRGGCATRLPSGIDDAELELFQFPGLATTEHKVVVSPLG
jgi:hypothetical protein